MKPWPGKRSRTRFILATKSGSFYSPRGEPHRFYERTEAIARREGLPADRACLLAIEEHVGVILRADLLTGPLATLVRPTGVGYSARWYQAFTPSSHLSGLTNLDGNDLRFLGVVCKQIEGISSWSDDGKN